MHSDTGETEPMSDETWAGSEMMHGMLGGGAEVDAEWARRASARDESASEVDDEADEERDPQASAMDKGHAQAPRIVPAKAGEPVALRGNIPEITVTLLEVQDPGEVDEDGVEPDEGMRYVGIRLRIENTGDESYFETPSMGAVLIGRGGDEYEELIGWLQPALDDLEGLQPGESGEGFFTFEVPEKMKPVAFRYAYSVKTPPDAAEWKL